MIEVTGITKRYGDTLAVDDLSFEVRAGQITGFLGPNGSGKSTTMRMIMGLDNPDAGQAKVNGVSLRSPRLATARGGRSPRGQGDPPRTKRAEPPLDARPDQRHPTLTSRRSTRDRRAERRGRQAARHLLPWHGTAPRHRRRAAGGSQRASLRRADQWLGPRRHPLGPQPAQGAGQGGPDRLRLESPHERDGADGRPPGRDRSGASHCRDAGRRIHRPELTARCPGSHSSTERVLRRDSVDREPPSSKKTTARSPWQDSTPQEIGDIAFDRAGSPFTNSLRSSHHSKRHSWR